MIDVVNPIMKPPCLMVCYWVYPFTTLVEVPEIIQTWTFLILIWSLSISKLIVTAESPFYKKPSHVQFKNCIVQTFAPSWMPVRDPLTPSRPLLRWTCSNSWQVRFALRQWHLVGRWFRTWNHPRWMEAPTCFENEGWNSAAVGWRLRKQTEQTRWIGVISPCNRTTS